MYQSMGVRLFGGGWYAVHGAGWCNVEGLSTSPSSAGEEKEEEGGLEYRLESLRTLSSNSRNGRCRSSSCMKMLQLPVVSCSVEVEWQEFRTSVQAQYHPGGRTDRSLCHDSGV